MSNVRESSPHLLNNGIRPHDPHSLPQTEHPTEELLADGDGNGDTEVSLVLRNGQDIIWIC